MMLIFYWILLVLNGKCGGNWIWLKKEWILVVFCSEGINRKYFFLLKWVMKIVI